MHYSYCNWATIPESAENPPFIYFFRNSEAQVRRKSALPEQEISHTANVFHSSVCSL
jgi:hypothetical protein